MRTQVYNPDFYPDSYPDTESYDDSYEEGYEEPSYGPRYVRPDYDDEEDAAEDEGVDRVKLLHDRFRRRHHLIVLGRVLVVSAILGAAAFFLIYFHVRNYRVHGSTFYTDSEIADKVMTGFLGDNSVMLSIRYRDVSVRNVPFVDKMDVSILNHDTIDITVYEKQIAGCVNYLGQYFYFTEDGRVCDTSDTRLDGVPEIYGLTFQSIALNEKIPVEDDSIFENILRLTQLLEKYELSADKIYLDQSGNMSVYFDNVRVTLGGDTYLDEKLSNLSQILPHLTGKNGTLKLADFTPETKYITFVDYDATTEDQTSSLDAQTGEEATTEDTSETENGDATTGASTDTTTGDTGTATQTTDTAEATTSSDQGAVTQDQTQESTVQTDPAADQSAATADSAQAQQPQVETQESQSADQTGDAAVAVPAQDTQAEAGPDNAQGTQQAADTGTPTGTEQAAADAQQQ